MDDLFTNSNMTDKVVIKTIQRSLKVVEDVKNSRDNAAATPPKKPSSSLPAPSVKRSLGFLVIVRDVNALAWAEQYKKPFVVDHADKEDQQFRPKVDKYYPFGTIKTQFVNYKAIAIDDKVSVEPIKLNVFARVGKGKVVGPSDEMEKSKSDVGKLKADQDKSTQLEPTELGVFRVRKLKDAFDDVRKETVCGWYEDISGKVCKADSHGSKFMPMKCRIPTAGDSETLSLDFTKLLEFDLLQEIERLKHHHRAPGDNPQVKYALCFIKPKPTVVEGAVVAAPAELKGAADSKTAWVDKAMCAQGDPKLTVVFDDNYEDVDIPDDDCEDDDDDDGDNGTDGTFDFNNYNDDDGMSEEDAEDASGRFLYGSVVNNVFVVAEDGTPLCGQSHPMALSDDRDGDGCGWVCRFCSRHGHGSRWVCQEACADNYCVKCACKSGPLLRHDNHIGSMTYSECVEYAAQRGTRLPTLQEVHQELERHGREPLFPNEDMWWPISDTRDTWVNVGNSNTVVGLGFTQIPSWSEDDDNLFALRSVIAFVRPITM